jgi:phenylacetate-coenzyme A ligase PaaK-like adenylate-forming protein
LERLIVTDMAGGPMPLIRFDTGDLVRRDSRLPYAPIKEFVGRKVDCLLMPNNTRISPYQITTALEEITELERYEVIQRADYGIDVMFWSHAPDTTAVAKRVQERIMHVCGGLIRVSARHTLEQLTLTGRKIRPVRSEARQQL